LLKDRTLSRRAIKTIHDEVETELDQAVEFARRSPFPSPDTVADGVWAE
jgi:TPP-dependent pyruvate/acetoin dehydrogenase alpha subunit